MDSSLQAAEGLLKKHRSLSTLDDVARWKSVAEECIAKLSAEAEQRKLSTDELRGKAEQLRTETRERSFLGHFFKSTEEKQIASSITAQTKTAQSCWATAEELQEKIDNTPSSKEEKLKMLNQLKAEKKELQLEKRELNAQMKGIRTEARQRSVDVETSFTALIAGSKYTAAQRKSIRASKERALAPGEDAKAALERKLLALDREITRIEDFS